MTHCASYRRWRLLLLAVFGHWLMLQVAFAQDTSGYDLELDGQAFELKLDTAAKLKLKDGREVTVKLSRKAFNAFNKDGVTFEHPTSIAIASTERDAGMVQHIGTSALGTLMLVQVHENVDLNLLRDTVHDSLLSEQNALKIPIEHSQFKRELASGNTIEGLTAKYKFEDKDDTTVEVGIFKGKSSYLVVTMNDALTAPKEKTVIDRFWKTLKLE